LDAGCTFVVPPTLTAGTPVQPNCTDKGSIAFTTTDVPNGNYELSYAIFGTPATAEVVITAGEFVLTNLVAGAYSNFAIPVSGSNTRYNTSIMLVNTACPFNDILSSGTLPNDGIDVSRLVPGLYLVEIKWTGGKVIKRFVKQ
jgi:hypothetical protein